VVPVRHAGVRGELATAVIEQGVGQWTMTATNHDDQLHEIYPTMLNELNCTFGVIYATADEAVAYMFYRCYFCVVVFFCFFRPSKNETTVLGNG